MIEFIPHTRRGELFPSWSQTGNTHAPWPDDWFYSSAPEIFIPAPLLGVYLIIGLRLTEPHSLSGRHVAAREGKVTHWQDSISGRLRRFKLFPAWLAQQKLFMIRIPNFHTPRWLSHHPCPTRCQSPRPCLSQIATLLGSHPIGIRGRKEWLLSHASQYATKIIPHHVLMCMIISPHKISSLVPNIMITFLHHNNSHTTIIYPSTGCLPSKCRQVGWIPNILEVFTPLPISYFRKYSN